MKRVFHPSLDSFQDVPDGDVEKWVDAGWRKTAPRHVTTDGLPDVGTGSGTARVFEEHSVVPVLEDTSRTTSRSRSRSGSRSTPSRSTGRTTAPTTTASAPSADA